MTYIINLVVDNKPKRTVKIKEKLIKEINTIKVIKKIKKIKKDVNLKFIFLIYF